MTKESYLSEKSSFVDFKKENLTPSPNITPDSFMWAHQAIQNTIIKRKGIKCARDFLCKLSNKKKQFAHLKLYCGWDYIDEALAIVSQYNFPSKNIHLEWQEEENRGEWTLIDYKNQILIYSAGAESSAKNV